MAKFDVICTRRVIERETITFEAATVAEALHMAAAAYCTGATEDCPHEYRWDDCGDVEELGFDVEDENGKCLLMDLSLNEAETLSEAELIEDYGLEVAS